MRYFYTDPIAAAWMERHHGMSFYMNGYKIAQPTAFCHDVIEEDKCNGRPEKYYIYPDSLHLLEPKVGDMIHAKPSPYLSFLWSRSCRSSVYENITIIQRNGLAFMWPEVEE